MFYSPHFTERTLSAELGQATRLLDRLMNDSIPRTANAHSAHIESSETAFTLSLDAPGVTKEQLRIGIEGRVLRVSSAEGAPRSVQAAWRLPQDADAAATSAKLELGVLTLTIPKKAAPAGHSIEIQ